MIRIISPDIDITPEDILGKLVWQRNAVHWTANEIPSYVDHIIRNQAFLMRPDLLWKNDGNQFPGNGRRTGAKTIRYRSDHRGFNGICCTCDTQEEVNTVRALGRTIREDYFQLQEQYTSRFIEATVPPNGQAQTMRMMAANAEIREADIIGKYVWRRPAGHWTANEYPVWVRSVHNGNAVCVRQTPVWDEEANMNVIRPDGVYKDAGTVSLYRFNQENNIIFICSTSDEVNQIRAIGKQNRTDHHAFWEQVNTRFQALADPVIEQAQEVQEPRI